MARSPWPAGIPRRTALALGAGLAAPAMVRAQARFPDRPIRLVVPFGAGGNLDTLARMLIPGVSERLGQPIVIENRAGAGGNIGTEVVARAQPDGYTLLLGSNGALTINPLIMERVPYDPAKDFAPVCLCFRTPQVLVISPKLPVKTLAEFVAYAKARPGQLHAVGVLVEEHAPAERACRLEALDGRNRLARRQGEDGPEADVHVE